MKTLLTALFLLCTIFACKKGDPNPDSLPPITQEGKNTFGCYVNGEVWVPYVPNLFSRRITPIFGNAITIEAQRFENRDGTDKKIVKISFIPGEANPEKTYTIGTDFTDAVYYDFLGCEYDSGSEDIMEGSITISKYDLTEEKIIAGTFEFTLGKEGCETLHFTEGRFDIKVP